jgi:hypothetical protein
MAMEQLTAIGWGLVMFGVIIGVGVTVLTKLGDQVGGTANTTIQYVITQMGSTGLAGWIPVIIVIVIAGLIFLYLGGGIGKGKAY